MVALISKIAISSNRDHWNFDLVGNIHESLNTPSWAKNFPSSPTSIPSPAANPRIANDKGIHISQVHSSLAEWLES